MPELRDTASLKLARALGAPAHFRCPGDSHPEMGQPTLNVGTISGGLNTNSVPDEARITIDTRTVPGVDHVHLCRSLETLLAPRAC